MNIDVTKSNTRDVIGRDFITNIHNNYPQSLPSTDGHLHAISQTLEFILTQGADHLFEFLDDYVYYVDEGVDVIGLEAKLKNGDREDLVEEAVKKKDFAAKRIMRSELAPRSKYIYSYIFDKISGSFDGLIKPMIKEGKSFSEIDTAIYSEIVSSITKEVSPFVPDMAISQRLVSGMLYYLTGKCHLVWK